MWSWLNANANPVMAVAAIVAVLFTGVGFGLTYYQLVQATKQLQSTNEYEIRKDLREIVGTVLTGEFDLNCLDPSKNLPLFVKS